MRLSEIVAVLALAGGSIASPAQSYVVHERRPDRNSAWVKVGRLDGNIVLPVKVGLTQQNLDQGHDWLMEVSDPASAKFGQHWSLDKLKDTFKPRYAVSGSMETIHTEYALVRRPSTQSKGGLPTLVYLTSVRGCPRV